MAKSKLERVDNEMSLLIDELVTKGFRRIDATKIIANKYKEDKDYAGFKD